MAISAELSQHCLSYQGCSYCSKDAGKKAHYEVGKVIFYKVSPCVGLVDKVGNAIVSQRDSEFIIPGWDQLGQP